SRILRQDPPSGPILQTLTAHLPNAGQLRKRGSSPHLLLMVLARNPLETGFFLSAGRRSGKPDLSPGAAYAVAEPDEEDPEGHGEYRHAQPRHAQQNHQDEHHEGQTQIIAEWVPERLEAWHHAL